MCSMLQVLGVLLASLCLGGSGEALRGQTTQDSGAEDRRLDSYNPGLAEVAVPVFILACCICGIVVECSKDMEEEEQAERAAKEAERAAKEAERAARKLAQNTAVQAVDEAMWEADFFGPHDPGQRTEILTQRLLGTGVDFSQRDASDQAKRLLAKHSHEAAWICR